jgi:hypothetical protein
LVEQHPENRSAVATKSISGATKTLCASHRIVACRWRRCSDLKMLRVVELRPDLRAEFVVREKIVES